MASISPILSEAGPSLEEILSRHGLKPTDLDKECPARVRDEVAVKLDDWVVAGCYLEFTLEDLRDINRENVTQELCRIALLDTWGKREGKKATYLKLASVLHRRQRCDLVEFLCAKFKSTFCLVPLSGSVTNWEIPSGSDLQRQDQGGSSSLVSPLDVPKWIETLIEEFDCLHERLVNEVSAGGISVKQVLRVLTRLPLKFRKEYESKIQSMLPVLERRGIDNLFNRLNPLFTFIDYELLQHLVSRFGSQELKQEMTLYTEKVQLFMKVTTVGELINHWPGLKAPPIDYTILRAMFADDPKSYTLEKLDFFRNRFYGEIRRSEFVTVSILMSVEPAMGSPSALTHASPGERRTPIQVPKKEQSQDYQMSNNLLMKLKSRQDYPSGGSVQQPQSPHVLFQPRWDIRSIFSKDMSNEQLALWLRNHPSLSGTHYEEDISKLIDARINGHAFLSLNERRLERFGVSVGFEFAIMDIIEDIKSSHQPPSSGRLPLQQQSPRSSVATSRTTQHQLSSSTAGQQTKIGHMCEFVEKPPKAFQSECPICLLVLRDPYQTTCCGKSFCKECIHRIKAANQACPMCNDKNVDLFPNKGLRQSLYDFQVYCTHKSRGCEWTGELRELNNHLNSDPPADKALQGCPYTLIKCPLGCAGCKKGIYRKDIESHVGDKSLRIVMIQSTQVAQLHKRIAELETKLSTENAMIASKLHPLGQPQQPGRRVTGTYKPVGAEFTMTNFDEYKRDGDRWYSPHFYTHSNGYKMCLRVDANGHGSGQGTHLSVFVYLMQGEFDDQLEWPFQGDITIKLIDQEEDKDHVTKIISSRNADERCTRVMTKERINNGWGTYKLLPLADLQPKYLKNDCIQLCIKKIEFY